jgi:hypothetical protein
VPKGVLWAAGLPCMHAGQHGARRYGSVEPPKARAGPQRIGRGIRTPATSVHDTWPV